MESVNPNLAESDIYLNFSNYPDGNVGPSIEGPVVNYFIFKTEQY